MKSISKEHHNQAMDYKKNATKEIDLLVCTLS